PPSRRSCTPRVRGIPYGAARLWSTPAGCARAENESGRRQEPPARSRRTGGTGTRTSSQLRTGLVGAAAHGLQQALGRLDPLGLAKPAAFVLDAHEAVIAGIGDDLHDPGKVEHRLSPGLVEVVALGRDTLGVRHQPGNGVIDIDRVLSIPPLAG